MVDSVIRCIERDDWCLLSEEELRTLEGLIDGDDRYRGCPLHSLVREHLGMPPVKRELDTFASSWWD